MLLSNLVRLSNRLGYSFTWQPLPRPALPLCTSKGLTVEFVGPPGVGKSTLFQTLLSRKRKWLGIGEYRNAIHVAPQYLGTGLDEIYQALAIHKMDIVANSDFIPTDKLRILGYFYSVLQNDKALALHNPGYTVVLDEGLLHNFSSSVQQLIYRNTQLDDFFAKRKVVQCSAAPETIAQQILRRQQETGNILPQHKGRTLNQLTMDQREVAIKMDEFCQDLQRVGIPLLKVNTEEEMGHNADLVKDFIER